MGLLYRFVLVDIFISVIVVRFQTYKIDEGKIKNVRPISILLIFSFVCFSLPSSEHCSLEMPQSLSSELSYALEELCRCSLVGLGLGGTQF